MYRRWKTHAELNKASVPLAAHGVPEVDNVHQQTVELAKSVYQGFETEWDDTTAGEYTKGFQSALALRSTTGVGTDEVADLAVFVARKQCGVVDI